MIHMQLNNDQQRILSALDKPSQFIAGNDNGIPGIPYNKIMKDADMSLEKTLLSLGYLESLGLVKHECAIVREKIDYLGQTEVEIAGQKLIRMFSLTPEGQIVLKKL
ncbi:hypothetical protein [Candidatus Hodarchaeum mangrovi]